MPQAEHEMRDLHRRVLQTSGQYLLQYIILTDTMWVALHRKDVFSTDMIQSIKACSTDHAKIAKLLEMLPARGPQAFDNFCEVLLECDHPHVFDYLKKEEVVCHFEQEVQRQTSFAVSEKLVSIFRKQTTRLQSVSEDIFEKYKHQVKMDADRVAKENKNLKKKTALSSDEMSDLRKYIGDCTHTIQTIIQELEGKGLSRNTLQQEIQSLTNITGVDEIKKFATNVQKILAILDHFVFDSVCDPSSADPSHSIERLSTYDDQNLSLCDKTLEETGQTPDGIVDGAGGIEKHGYLPTDVDTTQTHHRKTIDQKLITLLCNRKEIDRLNLEIREKFNHIKKLNQQKQELREKSSNHQAIIDDHDADIEQQRQQIQDLEKCMGKREREDIEIRTTLWNLLPHCKQQQYPVMSIAENGYAEGRTIDPHPKELSSQDSECKDETNPPGVNIKISKKNDTFKSIQTPKDSLEFLKSDTIKNRSISTTVKKKGRESASCCETPKQDTRSCSTGASRESLRNTKKDHSSPGTLRNYKQDTNASKTGKCEQRMILKPKAHDLIIKHKDSK